MKKIDKETEEHLADMITYAIRGAHSEIPNCCIYFWILYIRSFTVDIIEYRKAIPKGTEYIPCPKCLKEKNFVKIHICDRKNPICIRMMGPDSLSIIPQE